MQVNLIKYTDGAEDQLIYTKATRLTLGEETRRSIECMTEEQKAEELRYMATTIPSSWEFVDYTFEILGVSRAFTHQFVRTRTGSYAQQTMRMLNVEKFSYVSGPTIKTDAISQRIYDECMGEIQDAYEALIERGASIEDARGVLPTNICTNIIAKFSLRTLAELAKSRTGGRTQGEYQAVVHGMIAAVIDVHPWAKDFLFPDIASQVKSLEIMLDELLAKKAITAESRTKALKTFDILKRRAL